MHQHRALNASRDDEALLTTDQRRSGLCWLGALLIVLHDVGRAPGLGIARVAGVGAGQQCDERRPPSDCSAGN